MKMRYAYQYANVIKETGFCMGTQDTTTLVLNPTFVPIDDADGPYLMKYYWPLPETVTSFDDFQGHWYTDAAHTVLAEGLN